MQAPALIKPRKWIYKSNKSGRIPRYSLAIFLFVMIGNFAHADLIDIKLSPSNIIARAEFTQGQAKKPAVLLLHGFLQTHHFLPLAV